MLDVSRIKAIRDEAKSADDGDEIWCTIQPLLDAQTDSIQAALTLIDVATDGKLSIEQCNTLFSQIYTTHKDNRDIVLLLANSLEFARDIDDLNAAPPEEPLFENILVSLDELLQRATDADAEGEVIEALSCTYRLMARRHDDLAHQYYARLVELFPDKSWAHYNQGLFFKTRGYFTEGVKANQKAMALASESNEAYQWNLGICATGAGQGEIALAVWKDIGQKIELGRFELPDGGYPSCKVKLAEYPLAERDAKHDFPGLEETIWVERLSPCHGIIRSVLYQDLGVDFGDVILFDGAPVTYHKYGDEEIAVFPHLATLRKNHYRFYDFAGTQESSGMLEDVSEHLDYDAVIYSHSENFRFLCSTCWRDETIDHEHRDSEEKHVVTGRIAAPPEMNPVDLINQIDKALEGSPENRIFCPQLCRDAQLHERAQFEQRRYVLLCESSG